MSKLFHSPIMRGLLSGLAGFIGYGGWAFFVNAEFGTIIGVKAGLVQGSYSFILTLSTTLLMEFLMRQFKAFRFKLSLTIFTTCLITFCTAYSINWLFSTPEILLTILPGFFIGTGYTFFYVFTLHGNHTLGIKAAR